MFLNFQPLEQFEIIVFQPFIFKVLNGLGSSIFGTELFFITNSVLYTIFAIFSIFFFTYFSIRTRTVFSDNPWEIFIEEVYLFVYNTIVEQNGDTAKAMEYFNVIFTIFLFILFSNLIGLAPFSFTTTSFIIKTFFLSFGLLLSLTFVGLLIQGKHFFDLFVPTGVPEALVPMLVFIEVVSYISRAFSLAIRLFANMMSGHSLLNILSGFCVSLSKKSLLFGAIPFIIILAISFLEVGIAILQAYVFIVLLCIYMNDALYGHAGSGSDDTHENVDESLSKELVLKFETARHKAKFEGDLRKATLIPVECLTRTVGEEGLADSTSTVIFHKERDMTKFVKQEAKDQNLHIKGDLYVILTDTPYCMDPDTSKDEERQELLDKESKTY